jgi:hypothetical protein
MSEVSVDKVREFLQKITGAEYRMHFQVDKEWEVWSRFVEDGCKLVEELHGAIHARTGTAHMAGILLAEMLDDIFRPKYQKAGDEEEKRQLMKEWVKTYDEIEGCMLDGKWSECLKLGDKRMERLVEELRLGCEVAEAVSREHGFEVEFSTYVHRSAEWCFKTVFDSKEMSDEQILEEIGRRHMALREAYREYLKLVRERVSKNFRTAKSLPEKIRDLLEETTGEKYGEIFVSPIRWSFASGKVRVGWSVDGYRDGTISIESSKVDMLRTALAGTIDSVFKPRYKRVKSTEDEKKLDEESSRMWNDIIDCIRQRKWNEVLRKYKNRRIRKMIIRAMWGDHVAKTVGEKFGVKIVFEPLYNKRSIFHLNLNAREMTDEQALEKVAKGYRALEEVCREYEKSLGWGTRERREFKGFMEKILAETNSEKK